MKESLGTVDGRAVLRMERRFAHPREKVWRAITEPAHLAHWFPAAMEMDFRIGGTIHFVFTEGEGPPSEGEITELDPPRVFAYTWDGQGLRWELSPDGDGCLLRFTQIFDDRPGAASFAAGWIACLNALDQHLAGKPIDPDDGYVERHEGLVERFGLLEGRLGAADEGWQVRFERQFPYPVDRVWAALTGADTRPDAAPPQVGAEPPRRVRHDIVPADTVTAAEPPTLLEYSWHPDREPPGAEPAGRVCWELSQGPGGGRLVLTQTIPARLAGHGVDALAAWHHHLELLASHLGGRTRPWRPERVDELRAHYAEAVG